jgi:heavy metal sensor kinase
MLFGRIRRLPRTLAFRLTLWYAIVFILSAAIAFALFYILIVRIINQRTDADLLTQSNRLSQIYALQGSEVLQQAAILQAQAAGEQKMFFRLFYSSGVFFASSNLSYWKHIGIDHHAVDAVLAKGAPYVYVTQDVPSQPYKARVIYKRIGTVMLQLGYSLEYEGRLLDTFQRTFMVTMAGLLVVAMAVGWFMARRALAGVASVTRTARRISEDDLDTRVPVKRRHDEIDQLAVTFNQMLDRIKQLVGGIREMNGNIAHDLRSPITRIRGLAEVTLSSGGGIEDYARMAESTIEECDRLLHMINTMLAISRTEAGIDPKTFQIVDMAKLVRNAVGLFQPLADDKGIALQCDAHMPCPVSGNESLLQRLTANLLDNAIKYTQTAGAVRVSVSGRAGAIRMMVQDNGPGISAEDQARVFERFFRADQSRSQDGAGLGLSLALAIVHAHEGQIELTSESGQGSTFTVILPQVRITSFGQLKSEADVMHT